jgi:DNA repair protein RadC
MGEGSGGAGDAKGDKPDYLGHRQRLRARFLEAGAAAFPDYELLELILFQAKPRQDTKPLAKALMARFGSFANVIGADVAQLMAVPDMGEASVVALKAIQAGVERVLKDEVRANPVLSSWDKVVDYCRAAMARSAIEQFRLLFLDRKNVLIADEVQQTGTVDHTPVYPREVVKRALELGASAIVMVHNHPSGDPTPSKADVEMTRAVQTACATLGIDLHDHLVIGRHAHASLRGLGLMA